MVINNSLSLEQTKALYTINKAAKAYRDRRHYISERIRAFLRSGTPLDGLNETEDGILRNYGLESPVVITYPDFIDGWDHYWNFLKDIKMEYGYDYSCNTDGILQGNILNSGILSDTDEEHCVDEDGCCVIYMNTSPEAMANFGISSVGIEEILDYQKTIKDTKDIVDQNYDVLNTVKEFRDKIIDKYKASETSFYELKDCVLISSGAEPIAYHRMMHYEQMAAFYVINGFKFHMFVDDELVEDEIVSDGIIIDEVSSENKLEEVMDLKEAVGILLDYLGFDSELAESYLAAMGPDICGELGIRIVTPARKREYDEADYYCDVYDDYDDYESYPSDDWDDE